MHEVAADMLSFYEHHATPISAAAAQQHLNLLGLKALPLPQALAPGPPRQPTQQQQLQQQQQQQQQQHQQQQQKR